MSIVHAKDMLIEATKGKYAVGAFNITSLVQMEAILDVASQKKAPVIIQTSVKPAKFYRPDILVGIYRTLAESAPVPVCLHLDHCTDVEFCKVCASAGYTNIMIDASKQSYAENIRQTKEVCDFCHGLPNISVEGELGTVSGVEDQVKVAEDEAALANPEQALEFIDRTGVDLFAPAIGTAHGVYKTKNPKVDFERMGKIFQIVNGQGVKIPLVVHGGTGLPDNYITRLIEVGGSKFNVSTELKHVMIDTTYDYISNKREEYDPGKIDAVAREATSKVVGRWMDILGSPGKA
jgi:tagatose 1,6-diphosphate aldolase GatY/KbaY